MATYIINLERDPERRTKILEAAARHHLDGRIFPAIDAAAETSLPPHRATLSTGEVGCFLSHKTLLQQISHRSDIDFALILEDDAVLFDEFSKNLETALAFSHQREVQFAQLGWLPMSMRPRRLAVLRQRARGNRTIRKAVHLVHPSTSERLPPLEKRAPAWGTHCYLVKPAFARIMVEFLDGYILAPYDHYLRALDRLAYDEMWRTPFPLAGQDYSVESSVDARRRRGYQLDSRGRLL